MQSFSILKQVVYIMISGLSNAFKPKTSCTMQVTSYFQSEIKVEAYHKLHIKVSGEGSAH
jgi:hypothetical protein